MLETSSPGSPDRRKRYSGLHLQYGLPSPSASPHVDGEEWSDAADDFKAPDPRRASTLAEFERLQEKFAELARTENARMLGEGQELPPLRGFDGSRSASPEYLSASISNHSGAFSGSNVDDDDDENDDEDQEDSILMVKARDLKRALMDANRGESFEVPVNYSLSAASLRLVDAFKEWLKTFFFVLSQENIQIFVVAAGLVLALAVFTIVVAKH